MLGIVGADPHASPLLVGWIPTATQLGYAAGLLLLGPLADRFDRRRVILAKLVALTLALLLAGAAPSVGALLLASVVIGITATAAQDFVPAAATLAPAAHRGKLVGTVMTGLLLGILMSRALSGMAAAQFGWRAMFVLAAVAVAGIGVATWRSLPAFAADRGLDYAALIRSLADLWRNHPALRRAAIAQGLLGLGFSAFWSTLAVMLHGAPFHLGSAAAGAFGLAGAAGALAAPFAGRIADRRGPLLVVRLGATVCALAFLAMALLGRATFDPGGNPLGMLLVQGHLHFKPTASGTGAYLLLIIAIALGTAWFPARRAARTTSSGASGATPRIT